MPRTRLQTALAAITVALPTAVAAAQSAATTPHYHVVTRIPVGKLADGYSADFIIIDPVHRRLYGLGNTIIDIDKDRVVDSIPGKSAGGYALATDVGSGLARNGTRFDLATAHVTGHVDGSGDASVYDPGTHRAFMLDDTVTVVDMQTGTVVTKTAIAPKLESGVPDGMEIDRSGHKGDRHPDQRAEEIDGETCLKRLFAHHDSSAPRPALGLPIGS